MGKSRIRLTQVKKKKKNNYTLRRGKGNKLNTTETLHYEDKYKGNRKGFKSYGARV